MDPSSSTLHLPTRKNKWRSTKPKNLFQKRSVTLDDEKQNDDLRPKILFKSKVYNKMLDHAWPLITKYKQQNIGSLPKISFKSEAWPLTTVGELSDSSQLTGCQHTNANPWICNWMYLYYVFYQHTNINLWLHFVFSAYTMYFVSYIFVLPTY